MHVCRSVIASKIFVTDENDARYEDLFDIHSTLLMSGQEIVRMPYGSHVLHKRKVVRFGTRHCRCAFETFMQRTESEDTVLNRRLTMAELHDLLAP